MKIEKTIDRESKQKLYVQIYSIIKEKITCGDWVAGTQIPTEDELCKLYDVSKVTIREAIYELVREGYLKRRQGKGTFITESLPHQGLVMRTRLTDSLSGEGVTAGREILERGVGKPSRDIMDVLRTEEDTHRILCRNTREDGEILEEIHVPLFELESITDDDVIDNTLPNLLEEKGTKKISKVIQITEMGVPDPRPASQPFRKEDPRALIVQRIFLSSDGMPIACIKYIAGEQNRFHMEFERIK